MFIGGKWIVRHFRKEPCRWSKTKVVCSDCIYHSDFEPYCCHKDYVNYNNRKQKLKRIIHE